MSFPYQYLDFLAEYLHPYTYFSIFVQRLLQQQQLIYAHSHTAHAHTTLFSRVRFIKSIRRKKENKKPTIYEFSKVNGRLLAVNHFQFKIFEEKKKRKKCSHIDFIVEFATEYRNRTIVLDGAEKKKTSHGRWKWKIIRILCKLNVLVFSHPHLCDY